MRQVLGCQNKDLYNIIQPYNFIADYLSFRGETPNIPGLTQNINVTSNCKYLTYNLVWFYVTSQDLPIKKIVKSGTMPHVERFPSKVDKHQYKVLWSSPH